MFCTEIDELERRCDIVRWPGQSYEDPTATFVTTDNSFLHTSGGYYTTFLKSLAPSLVRKYSKVLVLMDDIMFQTKLDNFNLHGKANG